LFTFLGSGENFIACAKENRNAIEQIFSKKLILWQTVVKPAFHQFSPGVFLVGITVAKGA
jgi:hypothetical protein